MAEAFGIIAGGVQIATLAGQIAGVGMKMRALYHEIRDAPEELDFRLQEVHLLTEILGRPTPVSSNATSFCKSCLAELSLALLELESQVKRSRGLRQKMALTKVVLKKNMIQKLHNRLCRSVQLLQLAANCHLASGYGMILQNQDFMMSFLKTHFGQAREPDAAGSAITVRPGCRGSDQFEAKASNYCERDGSTTRSEDSEVWSLVRTVEKIPRWARTFGVPFVTGTVHFESNEFRDRHNECSKRYCSRSEFPASSSCPTLWARFSLPHWLSHRVLEVVAQRSRIGWKQYIRVRSIFPRLDVDIHTPFHEACVNIAYGRLQSLKAKIDKREVTPWDEDGRGETMWATALYFSQWEICNYLMDLGAEPSPNLRIHTEGDTWLVEDIVGIWNDHCGVSSETRRNIQAERRKLIERLDYNDGLRFSLLSGFEGDTGEFARLKRSIWPDERFYHPEFSQQRMRFAVSIANAPKFGATAPSMIRSILELDNRSQEPVLDIRICNNLGKTIFHGLASKIASSAGYQDSAEWHRLTCDILARVTDTRDLSEDMNIKYAFVFNENDRRTALMAMISDRIWTEASISLNRVDERPRSLRLVISGCETSIVAWLEDLHKSGIDLIEYGSNEQKASEREERKADPAMVPSVVSYSIGDFFTAGDFRLVYLLRLISFQYAKLPMDWKFWWNEPSDEFAGDFWRLVEFENTRSPMSMPGAWID